MSGSKPADSRQSEPEWIREAQHRGLTVEEVGGALVITKTDGQPLWGRAEATERGGDTQDSSEIVAVQTPADNK